MHSKLIGKDALEAYITIILDNPNISSIFLAEFSQPPLLRERTGITCEEEEIVTKALSIRESYGIPFWDALMVSCFYRSPVPNKLLDAAMYHQDTFGCTKEYSRDEIAKGDVQKTAKTLDNGRILAITSEVKLKNGSIYHIPMLDFHCPISSENLQLITGVLSRLVSGGALILESGESYHAFGMQIISKEDFIQFLGKSLLFTPIIDRAYIGHQLIEGRCALRISNGGRGKKKPQVVSVLNG
ncbi:MAG: hypothetical protein WC962_07760 [Phycisphaerae bacterium]|jgi:hypothetical protein